jgi:hypothetical protein
VSANRAQAGVPRINLQLRAIGTLVAGAIKAYGRHAKEPSRSSPSSSRLRGAGGRGAGRADRGARRLRRGRPDRPGRPGATNIATLQELLAYQKKNPQEYGESELLGTMTAIRDARARRSPRRSASRPRSYSTRSTSCAPPQTDDPV